MTTGFQSAKLVGLMGLVGLVGLVAAAAVYLLITVVALVSNATEVKGGQRTIRFLRLRFHGRRRHHLQLGFQVQE